MGVEFPADLKASLERHDGAGEDGTTPGRLDLAGGYGLMSLDQIVGNWRSHTEILETWARNDEPATGGIRGGFPVPTSAPPTI